jgi:hypothetical protein
MKRRWRVYLDTSVFGGCFDSAEGWDVDFRRVVVTGQNWYDDCAHVAFATIARADAIVAWSFKDLVRLDRIKAFKAVKLGEGYGMITILSPKKVEIDE